MVTFKIHQIKDIENTDYAFRGYNPKKFDFRDYECRYEMEFAAEAKTALEICDIVFHVFNMRTPEDFRGHSLSVSDIIEIDTDLTKSFYYCDIVGWTRVKC